MMTASPAVDAVPLIDWKLVRFNPRRALRTGAAEVEYFENGALTARLWMTKKDIQNNILEFGDHPELRKALQAYADNVDFSAS
jgi:hypothetical protein